MTTLAIVSMKGGVGKSTVTLGLAGAAWARGMRVLVIDMDPQANTTSGLDVEEFAFSTNDVLSDGRSGIAVEAVIDSGWGPNVQLIPSERALEHRNLPEVRDSSLRLRVTLTGVTDTYDLVLIDCPPSIGELTRNALAAADAAVIVTEPGYFAIRGAEQAYEAIEVMRGATNLGLTTAGIVVNRVRPNLSEHDFRLAELADLFGDLVLEPMLHERSVVQQAQGAGVPLQAWPSPGAKELDENFEDLLDELLTRTSAPEPKRKKGKK